MHQINILIADDEEDIREILSFLLESSIVCNIHYASDGNEAINQLNNHEIHLLLCDYNMPHKNGGEVYKHLLSLQNSCKYVMCSSDLPTIHEEFQDRSSFFGHIEKPNLMAGIREIVKKLKEQDAFLETPEIHAYSPISIRLLLNLQVMPSDVYIKLAEDTYKKVFGKDDRYDETDYLKFSNKGIVKLYVMNISNIQVATLIQETIKKISQNATPETKSDSVMQIHNILVSIFNEYGVQSSFVPFVEEQFKESLEICRTDKTLTTLMNKLLRNKESYLTKHSFILAAVTLALAARTEWVSDLTSKKLIISAMFHDIYLPVSVSSEVSNLNAKNLEKDFQSHPQKAFDLLNSIPGIPSETSRIILEQHEVGEGLGFPRGMEISKTTPLSQLFIFSHYIVDCIMEIHDEGPFDLNEVYARMQEISKKTPKFEKFFSLLRESNFFE